MHPCAIASPTHRVSLAQLLQRVGPASIICLAQRGMMRSTAGRGWPALLSLAGAELPSEVDLAGLVGSLLGSDLGSIVKGLTLTESGLALSLDGDALLSAPDLPPLEGVRVLRAGVQLGSMKGKVFAPDHALAMTLSAACGLPSLVLDRAGALRYQSGEALPAPEDMRGWALAVYEGLVLGFGKASGGQFKNHYPKGLRRP